MYDALRAGASGFLLKRAKLAQIAYAIRLVDAGESLLFPDATGVTPPEEVAEVSVIRCRPPAARWHR